MQQYDKEVEAGVGNEMANLVQQARAMHEALVQCELFLGNVSKHGHPTLNPGDKCVACVGVEELRGLVVRALSMPIRNCDVGTPEEQTARLRKFCAKYPQDCEGCPCCPDPHADNCWLVWAQMPYEKESYK